MVTKYKLEKALNTEDRWTQRLLIKEIISGLNAQLAQIEKGMIADGEAEKRLVGIIPINNPATERKQFEWVKLK
jgi:predicted nuclease of restriction endonuclease-like RecB superfamily